MSTELAATEADTENDRIEEHIILQLEGRPLVVDADSEVIRHLSLEGVSNTRLRRRLGSMVQRGIVLRRRREMRGMGDDDRPITYELNPRRAHA